VVPIVRPPVAESRVVVVADDESASGPSAIGISVLEGKKRRVDDSSEKGDVDNGEVEMVVLTEPRGGALTGPRVCNIGTVGGIRRGQGVPANLFVRRANRFVDR